MEANKPLIIFDTDMDTDCDDVGALAMLLTAHTSKKIELLGIVTDSVSKYAAPFSEVITRYYKTDIPIGAVHEGDYNDTEFNLARFEKYRSLSKWCIDNGKAYNITLSEKLGKTDRDYPKASSVYRELLSKAEDNSVTVLCVGMLTAIAEALESQPDGISPLSGAELFSKKVKCVITMGTPEIVNDFNWGMDAYATERFFELCPTPVFITPEGEKIITGEHLTAKLCDTHPLRRAYEIWLGKENTGRSSWDLIATLYAINPDTSLISVSDLGVCRYSAEEKRSYVIKSEPVKCRLLQIDCDDAFMAKLLNGRMLGDFTV